MCVRCIGGRVERLGAPGRPLNGQALHRALGAGFTVSLKSVQWRCAAVRAAIAPIEDTLRATAVPRLRFKPIPIRRSGGFAKTAVNCSTLAIT